MGQINPEHGIGTLVNHVAEGNNPKHAHVTPIYQTSTFSYPDVATGVAIWKGEEPGYIYTRLGNPNYEQLAEKVAVLEGLDLLRAQPQQNPGELVAGQVFATGMAAVTTCLLTCAQAGDTIIAQEAIYGGSYTFLTEIAPRYGIQTVWLKDPTPAAWEAAFAAHPDARLAYAESPANPTMNIVDLAHLAQVAHRYGAWVMADNTFATPFCQRPLSLGVDVVIHSTTKYLSGHGLVVGGVAVSTHVDWVKKDLTKLLKILGSSPSPFDTWLTNIGLKTFEIRMERHNTNAMAVAQYLAQHPKVAEVYYPGLPSHPGHAVASRQMFSFGPMLSFEVKGGFAAGESLMNHVKVATLAVSLGNVDTLIEHPASMTHYNVPREARLRMGLSDGLVRLSVGVENVQDILADLDQALAC
ncbi:MAG: PLP-dependent aspartate aminotransferase family protein [Anaerolineaceae bacterium]|nr:PLP-dependent aspartate aminotransferase family protein [Anaerolineaceae bacterium]MDD5371786.1 PLP-dependent aspartate aminotransferase family protein [Anaerolineaceae bacterium]